jgi:hypothetical protein
MKFEIPLRIVVTNPLHGVSMQVQRGRDELLLPTTISDSALSFEFEMSADMRGEAPSFPGKYAQGPKDACFVYVNSGTYAGQDGTCWGRRAKLSLMSITEKQIREVIAKPGLVLETTMPGTGRDGGPTCATVKGIEWKVARA